MGEKELAIKEAERAVMLVPRAKDQQDVPSLEENVAVIQTIFGREWPCDFHSYAAVTNAL